ncbi:MAG: hypothetical protein JWO40_467 [Candidatus Doudnabacteria bacterium]|nr:hypothetical protein [Candidatus Doudnabacteria bacterium]
MEQSTDNSRSRKRPRRKKHYNVAAIFLSLALFGVLLLTMI